LIFAVYSSLIFEAGAAALPLSFFCGGSAARPVAVSTASIAPAITSAYVRVSGNNCPRFMASSIGNGF